ncbi:hypothetical protein TWF481_009217 [Arthrobotrys musiformis]|uniref:Uncharacterized protein n=1 Tax=Arthrobotrys musiformis TaxID=47236 RepID=A0AAV9W500_9PEZI
MCRKVTYHKTCGHVTSRFQHRPCKIGNYCPRVTQELSTQERCAGCRKESKRVIERPAQPGYSDYKKKFTSSTETTNDQGSLHHNEEEEFQRRQREWFKRYAVDAIFDQAILMAQYMDERTIELRESRERRAERARRRADEGEIDDADSFKWIPKKWWRKITKWRTRPAMFLDGEPNPPIDLYRPNTYYPMDSGHFYSPEPVQHFHRTTLHYIQSPEPSPQGCPKTPVLTSYTEESYGTSPFDGTANNFSGTMEFDVSPLSLAQSSPSTRYSPYSDVGMAYRPYSSSSMSHIPDLDLFKDGLTACQCPTNNRQFLHPGTAAASLRGRDFPMHNIAAPSVPRDFFRPDPRILLPDTPLPLNRSPPSYLTPLGQGGLYPESHMDCPGAQRSFNTRQDGPWDRLHTLADLAVAIEMARGGDQAMENALNTVRYADSRSIEFGESLRFLSEVDYDRVVYDSGHGRGERRGSLVELS